MKRALVLIFVFLMLVSCSPVEQATSTDVQDGEGYVTGVWLSFSELDTMLQGNFKGEFDKVMQNCISRGITDIFVHVRPYCDALYKSKFFPIREGVLQYDFDVLEYMIDACHRSNIKFHAWINPYRVYTADSDISLLPDSSPAKKWLNDENFDNDINVSLTHGIYLNPASSEVRALILDGIREIIENYAVDGIHFDDYFYPTTDVDFDSQSYANYCESTQKPLSLDEWRRANVNALISGAFTAIKFKNKDIVFSVSPTASISENYSIHYADITSWIDSNCIDYIIPQLYFGFEYPDNNFKFDKLLKEWQSEIKNTDTKLLIGLATYKIYTQNEPDKTEWENGIDIIKKQADICRQSSNIKGHIYFSYTSMCEYL